MSLSCWSSVGASLLPFYLITLELIEEKYLLSSSVDRTVRLWSTDGEYVGKGQPLVTTLVPGQGSDAAPAPS